jgi:hypothetical protein
MPSDGSRSRFPLRSRPAQTIPLDVNIQWLMQQGWNPDLDRLRYSPDQLFVRRFDPQRDICVVCRRFIATLKRIAGCTVAEYDGFDALRQRSKGTTRISIDI